MVCVTNFSLSAWSLTLLTSKSWVLTFSWPASWSRSTGHRTVWPVVPGAPMPLNCSWGWLVILTNCPLSSTLFQIIPCSLRKGIKHDIILETAAAIVRLARPPVGVVHQTSIRPDPLSFRVPEASNPDRWGRREGYQEVTGGLVRNAGQGGGGIWQGWLAGWQGIGPGVPACYHLVTFFCGTKLCPALFTGRWFSSGGVIWLCTNVFLWRF